MKRSREKERKEREVEGEKMMADEKREEDKERRNMTRKER